MEYRQVPWDAFERHARPGDHDDVPLFESTGYHADLDELRRELGGLTSLEDYLRARGWEAAAVSNFDLSL